MVLRLGDTVVQRGYDRKVTGSRLDSLRDDRTKPKGKGIMNIIDKSTTSSLLAKSQYLPTS